MSRVQINKFPTRWESPNMLGGVFNCQLLIVNCQLPLLDDPPLGGRCVSPMKQEIPPFERLR